MRTILTHIKTRDGFPFEEVIGRRRVFIVDVSETLWTPDNEQEILVAIASLSFD